MKKMFLVAAFAFAGVASFAGTGKINKAPKTGKGKLWTVITSCGISYQCMCQPPMLDICIWNDYFCGTEMVNEYKDCPC